MPMAPLILTIEPFCADSQRVSGPPTVGKGVWTAFRGADGPSAPAARSPRAGLAPGLPGAETPGMHPWPAIMEARDAFEDLGERHGLRLRLRAGAVYTPTRFPGGAAVQIEVVTDELVLLMLHPVPVAEGPACIAALHAVLDVPEGLLPPARTWVATADLVLRPDRELEALPTAAA